MSSNQQETAWEKTKRLSASTYITTRDKALIPAYDKALKPTYDKALKPTYDKALKPGFDKAWKALDKLGAPINRLSNKVGAEAFWPTTLDKESNKAARILRSFCKDGFYGDLDASVQAAGAVKDGVPQEGVPQGKQRVLKKIPESVIRNAKGLAIFTTMRTGLWVSGAGGSGVLVARDQQTDNWSPPSGILLHTAGLGFLIGVDIYDCVIVINTYEALEAFTKIRCTLGGEISAVAGPVGIGGLVETEVHKRQAPLFTYLKSRGFYAGVQVDGTIVIERTDENEVFYGERIGVADILAGKAKTPPKEKYRLLLNTIRAAQGDPIDDSDLPSASDPTPGDFEVDVDGMSDLSNSMK
jgi:lipid-binding SYLF domain-containing protein